MSDVYSAPLNRRVQLSGYSTSVAHRQTFSYGKFFSYTSSDLAFGAAYRYSRLRVDFTSGGEAGYNCAVPSAITNQ